MKRQSKSGLAARKKIEAGNSRQTAKEYLELNDFPSSDFYNLEARRLDAEAEALLQPGYPVVKSAGGEVMSEDPNNRMINLIPKNVTTLTLDASMQRLQLLEDIDAVSLALDAAESIGARNSLEIMLSHQIAVSHKTAINLLMEAKKISGASNSFNAETLALKKQNMARMFMDFNVRAMEALAKIKSGGKQNITVTHKSVSVTGGQAIITDQLMTGGYQGDDE